MCKLFRLLQAVSRLCQSVKHGGRGIAVMIGEQSTAGAKNDRRAGGADRTALGVEEGF